MWSFICPELLKAIDTEPENEVLTEHMHALAKVTMLILFFKNGNSLNLKLQVSVIQKWMVIKE
jgi:hypothetical protein